MMNSFKDVIWDESLWFPGIFMGKSYGWKDLLNESGSSIYIPQVWDLHYSISVGICFVLLRAVVERYILTNLGYRFGIQKKHHCKVTPNPCLEAAYRRAKTHKKKHDTELLSKQTDLTERQIEAWLRKRKRQDATPPIRKFCESGWHFLFRTISCVYGLLVLWNKSWFSSSKEVWTGWPRQDVSTGIYWYYMIELGFYWSLIFTLVSDHKRADFTQMLLHHIASIVLIYFSWFLNFVRIGTLVLIIHDASDPWLEIAKLGIYLKWKTATDLFFTIFVLVWTVSRHFLLPYCVLYRTTYEYLEFVDRLPFAYYFFNFFLYLLMVLSCIWSYHIYKMVFQKLRQGEVTDSRSDSEEDSSPGETTSNVCTENNHVSGKIISQCCNEKDKVKNGLICTKPQTL